MATGDVTISTFLELRDNLSGGIKSVESQINRLTAAAKQAEDAIKRMKSAQAAKPPKPPPPPGMPPGGRGRGGAGGPKDDPFLKFSGGIFSAVVRANLLVDALEGSISRSTQALAGLLKYTVKVNEEYENTQLRITNTLSSMNLAPSMRTAAVGATEIMTQLREMSAKLPGEAKDYYNVFAAALPDALSSGLTDIKRYTEFAGKYTAVAMSRLVDAPQAGRDLQEMLQGRAHLRTKTFQELRSYIGMTAREFNKLAPEKRMTTLMDAVAKASGGMAMAADTANAKFGELKSRVDEIFILGGKPFFEGVKAAVSDINEWLQRNKQTILEVADTVSTVLGRAFRGIETIVESIGGKMLGLFGTKRTATAGMTYRELDKRREEVRRLMAEPFGAADISPHKWIQRTLLYGELDELTQRMTELDRAQARVAETREKFKKTEAEFRSPFDVSRATPEVQLMTKWQSGFFDRFETLGYSSAKEAFDRYAESMGLSEKARFDLWQRLIKTGDVELMAAPGAVREISVSFNNNRFDIRQAFAEGFDPDRIAVAFASDLGRLGEFQMQSALAPYASVQ